jgi:hypothetical protein
MQHASRLSFVKPDIFLRAASNARRRDHLRDLIGKLYVWLSGR